MPDSTKPKRGRPTKFYNIDLEKVRRMAEYGLIDEQIASLCGVDYATLRGYKTKFKEFNAVIKAGKAVADGQVVKSLYQRANGYEFTEEIAETVTMADGVERVMTRTLKKHKAPDVTAQIFWLKNRNAERWRDVQDVRHNGDVAVLLPKGLNLAGKPKNKGKANAKMAKSK